MTDVSGRGVGMDVVKRNIQEMGGHVEIRSQAGKGTTIRILLPLTLAILDGMSVKVNDEVFILPLNAVMECSRRRKICIRWPGANACCRCAANICRWWSCIGYLKWKAPKPMLRRASSLSAKRRSPHALLVDQLIGQHQVVVKNLESNYRKVPGISAATILGDGSVALIVDVSALQT